MEQVSMATETFALLGIGVLASLFYLPIHPQSRGWGKTLIKTTPLLCFALGAGLAQGPVFLILALLFSAAGDFALSRPGRMAFLYGLSAFSLAHIFLIILFLGFSGDPLWAAFASAPILAIGMLALAFSTEIWLAPHAGNLRWPVRIYVGLIGAMMLAGLTLPPGYWKITLGAALFVVSDLILALRLFRLPQTGTLARRAAQATWVFYIAGQVLIFWVGVIA